MKLECFATVPNPPRIIPGRPERKWMDAFGARAPYRCLPLTMANTSGWEILCPAGFTAAWDGGASTASIVITPDDPTNAHLMPMSHFAYGTITFHSGYLFRTEPGWALMAGGAPNGEKHGIVPLTGLVETDWLPFPFTMNWLFTAPGAVRFEAGEPFCFVSLVEQARVDSVQPVIRSLDSDPALKAEYEAWSTRRAEFNQKLEEGDAATVKESWQRFYFKGAPPAGGGSAPENHVSRRRLPCPLIGL